MDAKLALVFIFTLLVLLDVAQAEFFFNRKLPKQRELKALGLKCIPGRTVIKMKEKSEEPEAEDDGDSDDDARRSHMRFKTDDESCQVCVCSVEAKDEYCSNRPAMNVNECMRMAVLMSQFENGEAYDHERALAYMIRRDLIYHDGDLPYPAHSRCKRGRAYYSNNPTANDTDVEVASDVESLLDYSDTDVCYFCVCTPNGDYAGCISRKPWYCQFFREIRKPNAARHRYRMIFDQDRPAYFRHLSWRLRRTMDNGMFDLIENGGDSLCCSHSNGHRRQIHHQVRNKIRLMKNRVNKENLLSGAPVGDGSTNVNSQRCTPFVSMYSDCTDDNRCEGCSRCTCTAAGTWSCATVTDGCQELQEEDKEVIDDELIDSALDEMLTELQPPETSTKIETEYVPKPSPPPEKILGYILALPRETH